MPWNQRLCPIGHKGLTSLVAVPSASGFQLHISCEEGAAPWSDRRSRWEGGRSAVPYILLPRHVRHVQDAWGSGVASRGLRASALRTSWAIHEFHMKFMRHLSAPDGHHPSGDLARSDSTPQPSPPKPDIFASGGGDCGAPRCGETLFTKMLQATVLPARVGFHRAGLETWEARSIPSV